MRLIEFIKTGVFGLMICIPALQINAAELLMVESEDCPYCHRFHAEIGPAYPKTAEGKLAPLRQLMLGQALPAEYQHLTPAMVTPTFILVENQQEVDRLIGYPGDEHFWFLLGQMLEKLAP